MKNRTWNVRLTATDDFPKTFDGISHDNAPTIMRGLMLALIGGRSAGVEPRYDLLSDHQR